ncbi:MAG: nitrophenyl compound nitroreductase subunit ArsF family protein [Candidatus Eisenbacteria bacterium]
MTAETGPGLHPRGAAARRARAFPHRGISAIFPAAVLAFWGACGILPAFATAFAGEGTDPLTETAAVETPAEIGTAPDLDIVVVYYFHRTLRCVTCLAMEAAAREAVYVDFPEHAGAGSLEWKAVDFELPENAHFGEEYGLEGSSLVFAETAGGKVVRWEKIEGMWNYAGRPEELKPYVGKELRRFMARAKAGAPLADDEGGEASADPADSPPPRTGAKP